MDVTSLTQQLNLAASQREASVTTQAKDRVANLSSHDRAKVAELAEQFESIFINTMFQAMRKTVPKSDMFGGGNAEDIFRNMLDSEYAKVMAAGRSTGLADVIEKDLLKAMENRTSMTTIAEGQRVYAREGLQNKEKRETIIQGQSDSSNQPIDKDRL